MDNQAFWNHRYRTLPQLGSGPGSRGYAALYKNALVHDFILKGGVRSILDIGCGDLCWLDDRITRACTYIGADISEVVIRNNAAAHPGLRFLLHDIADGPIGLTADLVVSFDVLIHQTDRPTFVDAIKNTLGAMRNLALVSYFTPPLADGTFPPAATLDRGVADAGMIAEEERFQHLLSELPSNRPKGETAFYGPLSALIGDSRPDLETRAVGKYRLQTIYAITRRQSDIALPPEPSESIAR